MVYRASKNNSDTMSLMINQAIFTRTFQTKKIYSKIFMSENYEFKQTIRQTVMKAKTIPLHSGTATKPQVIYHFCFVISKR